MLNLNTFGAIGTLNYITHTTNGGINEQKN